jgi:hypothetical protein
LIEQVLQVQPAQQPVYPERVQPELQVLTWQELPQPACFFRT